MRESHLHVYLNAGRVCTRSAKTARSIWLSPRVSAYICIRMYVESFSLFHGTGCTQFRSALSYQRSRVSHFDARTSSSSPSSSSRAGVRARAPAPDVHGDVFAAHVRLPLRLSFFCHLSLSLSLSLSLDIEGLIKRTTYSRTEKHSFADTLPSRSLFNYSQIST